MVEPIDRTRYMSVPRTSGRHLLSLGRLLVKNTLAEPSPDVAETLAELEAEVARCMQAYIDRHREYGPSVMREEFELDIFVDGLLFTVRDRCDQWQVFEKSAPVHFSATQAADDFDYVTAIQLAKRARRASSLLFAQGLDYTRQSYALQAEHMLVFERLVEEEKLGPDLDKLVGAEFMAALRDGHKRYLAMVDRRTARGLGSAVNLRAVNADLQTAILSYMIAVLAMHRPKIPANVEMIRAALRPVDALREQIQRDRLKAQGLDPDELEEEDSNVGAAEEFLQEQEAVDAEIGFEPGEAAVEPPTQGG